jgi:uncharacterized protein (DUF58 family)
MPQIAPDELRRLAARALLLRQRLRATGRTPAPGEALLKFRTGHRTHDALGARPFRPGDNTGQLLWKPLALRDALVVREFRVVAEIRVAVLLDPSPSLLDDPLVGGFAVRLAFCLAAFGLASRHPTSWVTFGPRPAVTPLRGPGALGMLVREAGRVRRAAAPTSSGAERLRRAVRPPYTNLNVFAIWHCGYPLAVLEKMIAALAGRGLLATVFVPVSVREFAPLNGPVLDPETGATGWPTGGERLPDLDTYLKAAMRFGWSRGVRVEPLLIENPEQDLDTVLLELARL